MNRTTILKDNLKREGIDGPILLVTPWYAPTIGGVAVVAERLHRLFSRAGLESSVWVCSDGPEVPATGNENHGEISHGSIPASVFYGLSFKSIIGTLIQGPVSLLRLYRYVRSRRIQTVFLLYPIGYAWPFVVLRWLGLFRLISSCHGNEILTFSRSSRLARWLFREVLRSSDAITVPAAHLTEVAAEICPKQRLPIWLIPNCVDDSYFVPRPAGNPETDEPTLIHISAFTPRKRTLDIIAAFSLAKLSDKSRLLMVGAGPELQAAKELSVSLGVANRVQFVGAPEDVRPFLWKSDVLVMASDEESGPLTLLEAMACEVPWIMTPWGIAMTLTPGHYGMVVPARAPQKLALAMEEMLKDRKRLRAMGRRGREKVIEHFGESKYLESHLDVIRAVERGVSLYKTTGPKRL